VRKGVRSSLARAVLLEMKRILITGGAGYIGSVLARKLLDLGYEIVILDTLFYTDIGVRELKAYRSLSIVNADIRDLSAVRGSLTDVDCVIHLAAISNDPSAELDVKLTRQINLDIYPALLEQAISAGVRRFINMSSIGVYGINLGNSVTEEDGINPLTEYAACKAESEEIVRQYNGDKLTTVSLRCGTVCGWSPRMRFDLSTNTLTAYALVNRKLTVWGGDQKRPQIHVDDVADFVSQLLVAPARKIGGQIFNAAGTNITIMEIAEIIKDVLGGELELINAPPRADERTYHVSSEKIARELELKPSKTVGDAVAGIVRAYRCGFWKNPDDSIYHNVKRITALEGVAR
jgi:nucleoside-diphosphate-sugar epimerase